jgi:hypothetical protein
LPLPLHPQAFRDRGWDAKTQPWDGKAAAAAGFWEGDESGAGDGDKEEGDGRDEEPSVAEARARRPPTASSAALLPLMLRSWGGTLGRAWAVARGGWPVMRS